MEIAAPGGNEVFLDLLFALVYGPSQPRLWDCSQHTLTTDPRLDCYMSFRLLLAPSQNVLFRSSDNDMGDWLEEIPIVIMLTRRARLSCL